MKTPLPQNLPFLWGTATSSHQVEGNNQFNDWWEWEMQGRVIEKSAHADKHYELYPEDFKLIKGLGQNAHRLSIEWSRIEPRENEWNQAEIDHYREVLIELKNLGIEPIVTLHHFTHPQWFAEKGGWLNEKSTEYFSRYTEKVVAALGEHVRFWMTINEPLIFIYFGFTEGSWPPGIASVPKSLEAFKKLLHAHIASYQVIHKIYKNWQKPVWVSFAHHMGYLQPCRSNSLRDKISTWLRNWFLNHVFVKALMSGFLFFPGFFCESLPAKGTLDYLGLNYYSRNFIRSSGFKTREEAIGAVCLDPHHDVQVKERNVMGWDIFPEGIYQVLKQLKQYNLPVIISENGICAADDEQRARFIQDHLAMILKAKEEGVQVFGYLYWSLMDNFEWAHGYKPRFGLIEVDFTTFERKVRPSAQVLSRICRNITR